VLDIGTGFRRAGHRGGEGWRPLALGTDLDAESIRIAKENAKNNDASGG